MTTEREKVQKWVDARLRPRCPAYVAPFIAAVDAFDAIEKSGRLLPEQLQAIVQTVSSPRSMLCDNTAGYLGRLSGTFTEAADAILTLARSSTAHVRFAALLCLKKQTPQPIKDRVLRACLLDKSARVRAQAAWTAGYQRCEHLVPALEQSLVAEKNQKTRMTIERFLHLLRDGYFLQPASVGGCWVSVFTRDGTVRSMRYENDQIQTEGIESLAAQLRDT